MPKHSDESPYREGPPRAAKSHHAPAKPAKSAKPSPRRHAVERSTERAPERPRSRSRGGRKKKAGAPQQTQSKLTSHPTSRGAQVDTRAWLLKQYGPMCAYCGLKFAPRVITLDHVAPRRGQTAYDRRDNLVLACRTCNAAKRDQSPLAFLLGVKTRAANLLKYGAHLSAGLLDLARPLVRAKEPADDAAPERHRWGADDDEEVSPYRD
jgi:5-methylcytosine-specific restriction endonuclease McrA